MSYVVGLPNNSYKPITNTAWVRARLCKLQKGCTRFAAASDKVYQLLVHGRWFSPGTPASSTTKTGRHDIAEILLKVALNTINQIKSISLSVIKCNYYNLHFYLLVHGILYDITNLVCYAYFHWLFNPECQHIFGKQTGYICTFSVSLIWAPKNNNNVVDKNRNIYASLNQYHNTE